MPFVRMLLACWTLCGASQCFADEPRVADEPPTALSVSESLVEAFNKHAPAAMAALVTSDFELYYFNEEGKAELAVTGRQALAAEMTEYFKSRPKVRSEIAQKIGGPVFVSFREQIVGGASSLAVYEVREGLIRRAWYYPAEGKP